MSLPLLTRVSKASLPSAVRSWLFGPRTFTARSLRSATDNLNRRKEAALRLLQQRKKRPCRSPYRMMAAGGRSVYVHRVVMEIMLGRRLATDEHVHHADGNKHNNHPANLMLLRREVHNSRTNRRLPLTGQCPVCGRRFHQLRTHGRTLTCGGHCGTLLGWASRRAGRPAGARLRLDPGWPEMRVSARRWEQRRGRAQRPEKKVDIKGPCSVRTTVPVAT